MRKIQGNTAHMPFKSCYVNCFGQKLNTSSQQRSSWKCLISLILEYCICYVWSHLYKKTYMDTGMHSTIQNHKIVKNLRERKTNLHNKNKQVYKNAYCSTRAEKISIFQLNGDVIGFCDQRMIQKVMYLQFKGNHSHICSLLCSQLWRGHIGLGLSVQCSAVQCSPVQYSAVSL